jgi:hypothetical protein
MYFCAIVAGNVANSRLPPTALSFSASNTPKTQVFIALTAPALPGTFIELY